jgi:hypothetical protein
MSVLRSLAPALAPALIVAAVPFAPALAQDPPAGKITVEVGGQTVAVDPLAKPFNDPTAKIILQGTIRLQPGQNFIVTAQSIQFRGGAKLVIGPGTARITVAQFGSERGSIIAYDAPPPPAASVSPGQTGVTGGNGGVVSISTGAVQSVDGTPFLIDLSGQPGGSGAAGAQGAPGAKGADGQRGIQAYYPQSKLPAGKKAEDRAGDKAGHRLLCLREAADRRQQRRQGRHRRRRRRGRFGREWRQRHRQGRPRR